MRIGIIFLIVSFFSLCGLQAQMVVYPVPQEVKWGQQMVEIPAGFQLSGETTADAVAVNQLKSLLKGEKNKAAKFTICIGKRGDKAVRKYASSIPLHPEGYYLSVTKDRIVLAGNDERGTFYAVQTLRQLLQENGVPEVEIKDYPVVRFRGVVEGFYGTPWSHEARLRQLAFYGENKMNTYIYGPKDDPYHSCPNWRKPYPEKEAEQIRELAETARRHAVDFVWAIHPGQDIKWNEEDRNLLLAKFESMYQLGVRAFAVFFDDISGEGTNPERQADLLNAIDNHFVKVKGDVTPLIMCPTEYNKSWSNPAKGYLTTLGKKLNPGIQIMWTGDRVISDITEAGLAWVNEKINRPAYIWWNFPVSDYVRDHLLMGPVYGLDTHIGKEMSGFVTNPMEHAEASKIAIFCVADYTWNPEKYDSQISWITAVRNVLPGDSESLQVFVRHNSDLGPNGHRYRREESVEIQPAVDRFMRDYRRGEWSSEDYQMLMNEYARIAEAADILSMNQENKPLIEEIRPWLIQFKNLGLSGMEVLAMLQAVEADDYGLFMRKYRHVKALQQESYLIDQTYNQNPYQPGVKTGSKVMRPLIDSLFVLVTERYNQKHGEHLDSKVFTSPHSSYSTVAQFKSLPVSVKNNRVVVSPILEVVKWGAEEYLGVELDKAYVVKGVEADFGVKDSVVWLQLETSVDGKSWTPIPLSQRETQMKAELNAEVRFVRMVNKIGKEQEAYLRKFVVVL